jgi:hypothetical protein
VGLALAFGWVWDSVLVTHTCLTQISDWGLRKGGINVECFIDDKRARRDMPLVCTE